MHMIKPAVLAYAFFGLAAVACASSDPQVTKRSESDASLSDAAVPDGMTEDASSCACEGSAIETRQVSGTCGAYEESRSCDGCGWSGWQGQSPTCNCTPGQVGQTRQVEGGEGCNKGVRTEREICNETGTQYAWMPQGDFDGSLRDCTAGLTESRGASGACGSYTQTRECSASCELGAWSRDSSCNCSFRDGSNTQVCATKDGDDCGLRACQQDGTWGPCEDNPNAGEACEPCTPVCTTAMASAPTICAGERGVSDCPRGSGYASCVCQANGSWTNCSSVCFQ